jgi:predicted nucleic acid-binding protein
MNIFLDANVLVCLLNKEYPRFTYAARIISLADDERRYTITTTPICMAIAFYFAEKKSGAKLAKEKITLLASKLSIATVDAHTMVSALRNKKVLDFEDGLQYYAAKEAGCEVLITEDVDDYHFAEMEVLTAEDFLQQLLTTK